MKLTTSVENMEFHAFHGIHPEEAQTGGSFVVDLHLEQMVYEDREYKTIADVIDYEFLYELVQRHMSLRKDLLEQIASNIINELSERFIYLERIHIRIIKKNPAGRFNGANAVISLEKVL